MYIAFIYAIFTIEVERLWAYILKMENAAYWKNKILHNEWKTLNIEYWERKNYYITNIEREKNI